MVASDQAHRSGALVYAKAVANKVIVAVYARMVVQASFRGVIIQSLGDDTPLHDLSSGKLNNINDHVARKKVEFVNADLRKPGAAQQAVKGMEVVFHLAADHGGSANMPNLTIQVFT